MAPRLIAANLALLIGVWISPPCMAGDPEKSLSPDKFGHVDQKDTDSGPVGCGPTAAANGLQYLQNANPETFSGRNSLVPGGNLIDVANTLTAGMLTSENSGTKIEYFVDGLQKYLDAKAPGLVEVHGMLNNAWGWEGGTPSGIVENSPPTLQWLYEQLALGQAVFLKVGAYETTHYLTLTGITFDDAAKGQMHVVDPWGGKDRTINIEGLEANGDKKLIDTDYTYDGKAADYVFDAIAVSPKKMPPPFPPPVPEPETYSMMLVGLGALGTIVRRRKKAPIADLQSPQEPQHD